MPYDPRLDSFIAYFELTVLASYRSEPDKYEIETDHFEGKLDIQSDYYKRLNDDRYETEKVRIRFGYRTLKNGELKIAAFLPDFEGCAPSHVDRWRGFLAREVDWMDYDEDLRFSRWVRRNLEGSWHVEDGPAKRLVNVIELLNGLSGEAVGCHLYSIGNPAIDYPWAQNTHQYENAHAELYKVLLDGLSRECIERLAARAGRPTTLKSDRTLKALLKVFKTLEREEKFTQPLANVSAQRRRASHRIRPPAEPFKAFERFGDDLEDCVDSLKILCATLEKDLKMNAELSKRRQDALKWLPIIDRAPTGHFAINSVQQMVGKTVAKVEYGHRNHIDRVHESEAFIVHFTDGSIMGVDTGSNAQNILGSDKGSEFHVDLRVTWVPPVDADGNQ